MSDIRQFAEQFLKIPYKLGSFDPDEGLDCATFVLNFFEKYDKFPLEIEIDKNAYFEYSKHSTGKIYHEYILKYLSLRKYPCLLEPLDILVMKITENHTEHVGIYLENNVFIHCNKYGVRLHKLSLCKDKILFVGRFKEGIRHG